MENARIIGSQVLRRLRKPAPESRKGENGILLVVGGSGKYHGAPLLAIKTASRVVDLVYFHSPASLNHGVLGRMKSESNCFITLDRRDLLEAAGKSDCILVGNGLELNSRNKVLVNTLLRHFRGKKFVLDAGALHLVESSLLGANTLVTPHSLEFKALFGVEASPEEAKRQAAKRGCVILLKQRFCYCTDGKSISRNANGNEGMTKGGTGDVLAGLCAAFACKNPLLLSAEAAAFANGLAGDMLEKERGVYYNADDLAGAIPLALKKARALKKAPR